jgi:hypothetical protein
VAKAHIFPSESDGRAAIGIYKWGGTLFSAF